MISNLPTEFFCSVSWTPAAPRRRAYSLTYHATYRVPACMPMNGSWTALHTCVVPYSLCPTTTVNLHLYTRKILFNTSSLLAPRSLAYSLHHPRPTRYILTYIRPESECPYLLINSYHIGFCLASGQTLAASPHPQLPTALHATTHTRTDAHRTIHGPYCLCSTPKF
ncbi:hypothetical protein BD779DRAFT_1559437 [Infundibulicybe gibba]|nr:hypothetical protein BD779DRAFT_1559437 [Infundibulicybe gibba]